MSLFSGTTLPDDFFAKVEQRLDFEHRSGVDATGDAVLAVLGRPLTAEEKLAILKAAATGKLSQSSHHHVADTLTVDNSK
jgi:hypothetical protein